MRDGVLFLGRQSMVDKDVQLIGYKLLCRNKHGTSEMSNKQGATANVLRHILSGINAVVGKYLAFEQFDLAKTKAFMLEYDISPSSFQKKYFEVLRVARLLKFYLK